MRCKPHDRVIVINGAAVGALGTIIDAGEIPGFEWVVEFDRPMECWSSYSGQQGRSRQVNFPDNWLLPIRPDADPVETETEREVAA